MKSYFDLLDSTIGRVVAPETVEVSGHWVTSKRRTYASPKQLGSGLGPFAEVLYRQWEGTLRFSRGISAVGFLFQREVATWVKSSEISSVLTIGLGVHEYPDSFPELARVAVSVGGGMMPSIGLRAQPTLDDIAIAKRHTATMGHVTCVAEIEDTTYAIILLPGEMLEMGRNRLWRLREQYASQLPPDIRGLMTRRRTGKLVLDGGSPNEWDTHAHERSDN